LILLLFCTACGETDGTVPGTVPAAGSGQEKEDKEDDLLLPGGPSKGSEGNEQGAEKPSERAQPKSTIYPPSIFVIEASGSWRQELAPGYYADYECEFYADKLDEASNQSAAGQYTGVFWMKTKLDTGEYLKDLLKDIPVQMKFDAGGEGVCDYISVILMNGFERQSMGGSYTMPDKNGETLTPSGDTLAARGSFIAEATDAYLDVKARGAAGETVEHQDNKAGSTEIDFVIHVAPDLDLSATERKVTIHFSTDEGMAVTLNGVLHRLPGYSEDLKAYTSKGKREEILNKHLE
jgi:hypothetical protein